MDYYLDTGIEYILRGKTRKARWLFEKALAQIEVLDTGEAAKVRDLLQVITPFDNATIEVAKAQDVAEKAQREADASWSLQESEQREVASRAAKAARASADAAEKTVVEMRPGTVAAVSAATSHDCALLIAEFQWCYRKAVAARETAESAYRDVKSARQRVHELAERKRIAILINQSFNKGIEAYRRKKYDTAIKYLTRIIDPPASVEPGLEARARCFVKVVNLTRKANNDAAEAQVAVDDAIHHASGPWDPEDSDHREAAERAVEAARDNARVADRAAERTRDKAEAAVERTEFLDDLRVTAVERAYRNVTAALHAAKTARLEVEEARRRASDQVANRRNTALTEIDKLFKIDFLSADDNFSRLPCSRFVTKEDYQRRKAQFVQGWAKRALRIELDYEQAVAVSATRGDVLVTARAGSGKTRTIVTRTIFLLRHCRVSPHALLLLAFNKKASRQIQDQIKGTLGADAELPQVMTFHALAYAIVDPDERLVFDDRGADSLERSSETQASIDEFIRQDGRERGLIRDIMLALFRNDWELLIDGRFHLPMDELVKYRYSLPRETLKGEHVKSYGEKVIANTLFEHGVNYEYERSFRWNGGNYRPDFTIFSPEGAQGSNRMRSVIEYFGLQGEADYDAMSDEKRMFWHRRSEAFLEYTPRDIASQGMDAFVEQLLGDLRRVGIAWRRLSDEEIWRLVRERAVDSFSKAMTNFIGRCRKLDLTSALLEDMVTTHEPINSAEEKFLKAALPIYSRYLKRLEDGGKEDFDGLMWRAIKRVQQGAPQFVRQGGRERRDLRQLRFVMIDEFQDFSRMFLELTCAIRSENPAVRFFAVGDDWQAINAFAGSDLEFFKNFEKYFNRETCTLSIRTNYRSASAIVKTGNSVMRGYGEPAVPHRSEAGSAQVGSIDDFRSRAIEEERHRWDDSTPAVLRLVSHFLKTGKPDAKVVLLSRTNVVPWMIVCNHKRRHDRTLDGFGAHIHSYLPESERKRVHVHTVHSYKGREDSSVIVLDALEHRYPLIHPHWIFTRVFGDTPSRIVGEERRLLYVAMTRAKNNLVLLTDTECEASSVPSLLSSALNDDTLTSVSWEELPAGTMLDRGRVEVRVYNQHAIYQTKQELKDCGYMWRGEFKPGYWCRTFAADDFAPDRLSGQPWGARGVTIQVHDATDGRLLYRL